MPDADGAGGLTTRLVNARIWAEIEGSLVAAVADSTTHDLPAPDSSAPDSSGLDRVTSLTDVTVELIDWMGSDWSVIEAARVSTGADLAVQAASPEAGDEMSERDQGLIRYLMRSRHGTPFEHASLKFHVRAPIFVFREWHRHRIGHSYNELSGRYVELPSEFYYPGPDRPLVQRGSSAHPELVVAPDLYEDTVEDILSAYELAWEKYQRMLERGVAREVARIVLPVGVLSRMYWTCNPRSLMAWLSLRTEDPGATFPSKPLHEIELAARQVEAIFRERFPVTAEAFDDFGRVAP